MRLEQSSTTERRYAKRDRMRACKTVEKITRLISSHARLITTWFVIAIGVLLLSVLGPFNGENQVIVAKNDCLKNTVRKGPFKYKTINSPMTVHNINSLLAILARLVVDEGETAGFVSASITTQVNSLNAAKLLEQLLQIVLSSGGRDV